MKDESFYKSIQECVRCGSCKTICPTYEVQCDETMSGRGRIAIINAILSGAVKPSRSALMKIFSCIQCGACSRNCPPGIDVSEVIYTGRRHLRKYHRNNRALRGLIKYTIKFPDIAFNVSKLLKKPVNTVLKKKGLVPHNFAFPDRSLKHSSQVITPKKKIGRVAVFRGCSTNYLFPHLGESLLRVLINQGFEVILPKTEVCCGIPFRSLGMEREAKEMARRNLQIFGRIKADAILSLCPTCILALKKDYPVMINDGISNAMDISSFLRKYNTLHFHNLLNIRGFYHDPCHMLYGLDVKKEPRDILGQCGVTLPDSHIEHACCGFGGIYSMLQKEESLKLAEARRYHVEQSSAQAVFTSCPGCVLQLKKTVKSIDVFHIIQAIDEAVG